MSTLSLKRRRDIGRQKWQFFAVFVTVVLGVALFAGMFNAYLNLGASLEGTYERLVMADMTVTGADEGFVDTAKGVSGVSNAIERRQADVPFTIGSDSLLGRAVGMPGDAQPAINMIDMVDGSYLDPDDDTKVIIEDHAAETFDVAIGDTITILDQEVTVVGRAISPEYLWPAKSSQEIFTPPGTFAVVFVSESLIEPLSGSAVADQVLIEYDADVVTENVDEAVENAAEAANAASTQTLADQPSNTVINEEIGGLQTMSVALPLLFLTAAGMAIYVVITRMVYSQRGVIGTLRATGMSAKTLSRHYRSYGVNLGLIGAVVGSILGGLMARGMTSIYTQVFDIPDLVANFHLPTLIMSLLFGVVAGWIAAVAPARVVAGLPPAEAMRGDSPTGSGRTSLLERMIPPLQQLPVRWRMTLRGMGRNKKRSFALVFGVILSCILILAAAGTMDTMIQAFNKQFNDINLEDAQAFFSVPVGDEQVEAVGDAVGVEDSESVLGFSVTIRHDGNNYTTAMQAYDRGTVMHGFPDGEPSTGVLLGQAMQELLEVDDGDSITVTFSDLETDLVLPIQGFVDEPLATLAYISKDMVTNELEEANGDITADVLSQPGFTSVMATYIPGTSNSTAIQSIENVDGVAVVVDSTETRELFQQFQLLFYVFIGLALVFGATMAFALIFNIISVNVAERTSEFASMRANGLTHRKVAAMIRGETFILTAIGIVPGLIAGYFAAVALINSYASDQIPIQLDVSAWTYALTVIGLFVVAALSLVPAVRAIKRINVGEIVRERSV